LVTISPKYGRLFLHPHSNESATFFTHSDVVLGKLFFHAFDVPGRAMDAIGLELRSDSVQPARIVWPIDIRPSEGDTTTMEEKGGGGKKVQTASIADHFGGTNSKERQQQQIEEGNQDKVIIPPPPPDMNYHFPVSG
jgi:hypothetical protein